MSVPETLTTNTGASGDLRYLWRLVAVFALGWAAINAGSNVINPLLPQVRAEFALSGTATGLLTWAFTLPYMLLQIPAGMLGDRFGSKRLLVGMTALAGLGLVAAGLWSYTLLALVVFFMLSRLGAGVYYPTAFGVTAATAPQRLRGTASSILVVAMAIGVAAGQAIAVPLSDLVGGSWRFPMLVLGLLTLAMPVLFQLIIRPAAPSRRAVAGNVAHAFRDRSLVALFGVNFCSNYAFTVAAVWGPSLLSGERGISPATAGYYIALLSLVGFPAGLLFGFLSDRVPRRWLTLPAFIVAGLMLLTLSVSAAPVLILFAVLGYGTTGKWSTDGALTGWLGDHVAAKFPANGNALYGIVNTARMVGGMLAPLVTGILLDRTGSLSAGFIIAAVVLVVAALLCLAVDERAADKLS